MYKSLFLCGNILHVFSKIFIILFYYYIFIGYMLYLYYSEKEKNFRYRL